MVNLVDGEAFTADADDLTPHLWISLDARYQLNEEDKTIISSGEKLTDKHINFAQEVFKKQFPALNGLKNTLLLTKQNAPGQMPLNLPNYLQIAHIRSNHWVVFQHWGVHTRVLKYTILYTQMLMNKQHAYLEVYLAQMFHMKFTGIKDKKDLMIVGYLQLPIVFLCLTGPNLNSLIGKE